MKIIKILWYGMFALWFCGAFLMMCVYEIERKYECIDQEGWLKGIFWCESDLVSRNDLGKRQLVYFIEGLSWPIKLFSNNAGEKKNNSSGDSFALSLEELEEFYSSSTGTIYKCYIAAMRGGLNEEASILAKVINKMRNRFPDLNSYHEDYLFYTSSTLNNLLINELKGDYISFFDYVCKEPVRNMKQVLDDGMF
ncbi:conserved hypothetical protein [Nitrosomonas nitrosa]|uniref:DUF4375 domain-containing protein n=1 Tax=Nitrosomonas nitrosa TaxID=52442 RepID=A0A8H9DAP6_9PROT|nr:hypothetical protein [Nitrosomonas nitrosa]CAE6508541.1 conserved hypothetical protein [Nitrosomonas nitrosa]